jgi:hypothetical protein
MRVAFVLLALAVVVVVASSFLGHYISTNDRGAEEIPLDGPGLMVAESSFPGSALEEPTPASLLSAT